MTRAVAGEGVLPLAEVSAADKGEAIRVLVVDDHHLVREGLRRVLALDGEIEVVASQADGKTMVEVRDSAAVITDEDRMRLLDPYYRGGDDMSRQRVPGLGLGLTISKRIIELHEGKVWVESREGRGNTFVFSLPVPEEGMEEPRHADWPPEGMGGDRESTHH